MNLNDKIDYDAIRNEIASWSFNADPKEKFVNGMLPSLNHLMIRIRTIIAAPAECRDEIMLTGLLRDAHFAYAGDDDRYVLVGKLYHDIHKRWKDGEIVRTSLILEQLHEFPGLLVFRTRNSVYQVELTDDIDYKDFIVIPEYLTK